MKYMGSKARIAKEILPIILKDRKPHQYYIEPFVGGCNMIDKVDGNRIGNDINYYIIEMWEALQGGWVPPIYSKEEYNNIKNNKDSYEFCVVGWVGINCSYSGKWFGGYAGKVITKDGIRDYQQEAINNTLSQVNNLKNVFFISMPYDEIRFSEKCILYCDPPYQNTTPYKDDFDHDKFWQWCRDKTNEGHQVFISEYKAPDDFECIWSKQVKSSLSANGKIGGNKNSTEKLFRLKQ